MMVAAKISTALVALLHLYFLYLEMFVWTTTGKKVFRNFPEDLFEPTKKMAANQGLYNGFLAAGLVWSLFIGTPVWSSNIALFFLGCVVIAGSYGGFSISKRIFYIQAIPALIAMILILVPH